MRIIRYFGEDGACHLGLRDGARVWDLGTRSTLDMLHCRMTSEKSLPCEGLRLDAPIRDCPKLLALAGNYRKHVLEAGFQDVDDSITPQVFWKPNTSINAPGGVVPIRPNNQFVDWEIELGVIIGRRSKDVPAADAMESVFGYTVINDISERKFNAGMAGRKLREYDPFFDWLMGKWFDGHAPMGPEIVTKDEIPDPHDLRIRLWVNDELMQDSTTGCMLFGVPQTIAYISRVMTLEPGDVIAMGTPEGVGMARGISLKPGDRLRGEVEKIGVLENVVANG